MESLIIVISILDPPVILFNTSKILPIAKIETYQKTFIKAI